MTDRDIEAGLRLSAQNGWNQLEADWRRQLDLDPDACFMAAADGQVVGTACACVFETVAWINLVLVDQAHRGRGIGTRLMRHVLDYLDRRGVPGIRLDATPLGQPIYEKLGFVAEYTLTRFGGTMGVVAPTATTVTGVISDLPDLVALDTAVTSTPRGKLLDYMLRHQPDAFETLRCPGGIIAYAGRRPGARAWQIGPCLGGDGNSCELVLNAVAQRLTGESVFIDVPTGHPGATAWAATAGLAPQRTLTRMGRGPRVHEHLDSLWASFGPEKG